MNGSQSRSFTAGRRPDAFLEVEQPPSASSGPRLEARPEHLGAVASTSRNDQPPAAAQTCASSVAPGSAAAAYSSRIDPRDGADGGGVAGGDDRLVEPVGVDGVVDVGHRVELLRADRERVPMRRRPAVVERHPAEPNVAGGDPERPSKSAGIRVGTPRSSIRTQSMSTVADERPVGVAERPSGGATQTRR